MFCCPRESHELPPLQALVLEVVELLHLRDMLHLQLTVRNNCAGPLNILVNFHASCVYQMSFYSYYYYIYILYIFLKF